MEERGKAYECYWSSLWFQWMDVCDVPPLKTSIYIFKINRVSHISLLPEAANWVCHLPQSLPSKWGETIRSHPTLFRELRSGMLWPELAHGLTTACRSTFMFFYVIITVGRVVSCFDHISYSVSHHYHKIPGAVKGYFGSQLWRFQSRVRQFCWV